jgi:hypothetical protein
MFDREWEIAAELLPELESRYPPFTRPAPRERASVARAARLLQRQTGLRIRPSQVLVAPWMGDVRTPSGRRITTSEGWRRDAQSFWSVYARAHPALAALLGATSRRRVTPAYARAMGWSPGTVGQPLVHHHIDNGPYVVAIPASTHTPAVHRRATIVARP